MESYVHLRNFVNETVDNTTDVLENVLFTKISEKMIGDARPSQLSEVLSFIEADWGLNLKRSKHFYIARKILIKSAKNN